MAGRYNDNPFAEEDEVNPFSVHTHNFTFYSSLLLLSASTIICEILIFFLIFNEMGF